MDRRSFLERATAASLIGTTARLDANAESPSASNGASSLTERLNPQTQHARQIALKHLRPTDRELQRGLELHAASLVFDTYGFSPRAAVDGDRLATAVADGVSDLEYKDLREEMSMTRAVTDPVEQADYREAWRASGVTCIFQNAGEESQEPLVLLKRLARFTYVTDMLKEFVVKAVIPDDIVSAKQNGQHCLYLTGNGVPLTQQWVSVEDELRYLRIFFQLGIRMMHLTYQRRNMIGDGCAEPANAGLSDFGRHVIQEMNRVGVIPDCAHSGWRTSLEAAQISEKPVVASHSTCGGIHPHIRSKPDEVLKAIADTGGLIGMCCISRFLRGSGDINAFLDHIDYAVKLIGVDHVGIGTDVAYGSQQASAENKKVPSRGKRRAEFRTLWPVDDFQTTADMRDSLAWTNWPLFTVGLVKRGYTDEQIRKIIGGNMLRISEESLA